MAVSVARPARNQAASQTRENVLAHLEEEHGGDEDEENHRPRADDA